MGEEYPIVRHEAAEALSNFFDISEDIIKLYDELLADEPNMAPILKSTLVVATQKLLTYSESTRFGKLFLGTIEPAEPMNKQEILVLMEKTLDLSKEDVSQFEGNDDKFWEFVNKLAFAPLDRLGEYDRHRVAYFLRDKIAVEKDQNAIKVVENFLRPENRNVVSALLRHEIGFIFGQ